MKRKPFEASAIFASGLSLLTLILVTYALFVAAMTLAQGEIDDIRQSRQMLASMTFVMVLLLLAMLMGLLVAMFRARQNLRRRSLKAEKALQQNEELLRQVFETVAEGIYIVDVNGRMTFANRGMEQILGVSRAQIAERTFDDSTWQITTVDGQPFPADEQPYRRVMRTGKPVYDVEQVIAHADGRRIVVSINAAPLTDASGALIGEVASLNDITARKQTEEALRESEKRYRHIVDQASEIIYRTDAHGRFTYCNRTAVRLLGFAEHELLGRHYLELVQPAWRKAARRLYREQLARQTPNTYYEFPITTKDGGEVWVGQNVQLVFERGVIVGFQAVARDITERKHAEDELRKSLTTNRALLNAIPDQMLRLRADGVIVDYKAGRDGVTANRDGVLQQNVRDLFLPDVAQRMSHAVERALHSGEAQSFEYQLVGERETHDYEARVVACSADESLAIVRDISERKDAERMKNEFLATVSHELRTPLTSIRGSLGLIAGGVAGEVAPQAKAMIEIAYKNSERLVRLINDILDIEKIESGKMVFQFKPLDLMPLIEHTLEANRAYAEQFDVKLALEHGEPSAKIHGDADRLVQVLTNLLSNATKFSPPHETVRVAVTQHDGTVRVSVSDRGPGIPDEFRARIFQKFAQADSSDKRKKGGTGLGLSIVKAIVEKHGGVIGFESQPQAGTTFYFELPLWREIAPSPAPRDAKPQVLVCEDDADVASLLSMLLREHGFGTQIAYTAAQAKQALAAQPFAALTLDLMLPDQDGVSLIRELRQHDETRRLPIVVVSAKAEQGRCELNGDAFLVVDWLSKPIDQTRLVRAVQTAARAQGKPRILHVEDDHDVVQVVQLILQDVAEITQASTLEAAAKQLASGNFELVLLDAALAHESSLELLAHTHPPQHPPIPVVVFSGQEMSAETSSQVAAALVKTRTTNQQLLDTIQALIQPRVTAEPCVATNLALTVN